MAHKYIKFTGDFSQLKNMGYDFQRLYAANYMQWCNGDFRVWKKGSEVTIDHLRNREGQFFEMYINGQIKPQNILGTEYITLYYDRHDNSMTTDRTAYDQQFDAVSDAIKLGNDIPYSTIEQIGITPDTLKPLDELIALGWVELDTL